MNLEYGLFPKRHPMPWEIAQKETKAEKPAIKRVSYPKTVRHDGTRHYKTPMMVDAKRCAICEGIFSPKNGKQLYCGEDCYRIAKAEKARERKRAGT